MVTPQRILAARLSRKVSCGTAQVPRVAHECLGVCLSNRHTGAICWSSAIICIMRITLGIRITSITTTPSPPPTTTHSHRTSAPAATSIVCQWQFGVQVVEAERVERHVLPPCLCELTCPVSVHGGAVCKNCHVNLRMHQSHYRMLIRVQRIVE